MVVPVTEAREALFAVGALEWLLASVQAHVYLQVRLFYGCLGAVRASVDLDLTPREVPLFEMPLQALVARVAAAASGR